MVTQPKTPANGITLPIHWHIVWAPIIGWLLLAAAASAVSIWIWTGYIKYRDRSDQVQAAVAHDKMLSDQNSASISQQQVDDLQKQVQQLAVNNAQLVKELQNAIAQRNTATVTRTAAEATAPPTDLAARWAQLVPAVDGGLGVNASGIAATTAAARATVQALENGESTVANYQDLSRLDSMKDQQIAGLNKLVDSLTASAKATQAVLQDQVTSCKTEAKVAADAAAKKSRKSFWHGAAAGAAAVGVAILHWL